MQMIPDGTQIFTEVRMGKCQDYFLSSFLKSQLYTYIIHV
jgi:hypothetical protein